MEFAVATVEFWQAHGFDVDSWRKSVDGTKALVHLEYARVLIPNIKDNPDVQVYAAPSAKFDELLSSLEWASNEVV
jgi:hypothetical protein